MAHTSDQEMMRLHNRIDVLEKENRMLRSMLLDAIGITDAALADCGERKEKASRSCRSSGRCRSGAFRGASARDSAVRMPGWPGRAPMGRGMATPVSSLS